MEQLKASKKERILYTLDLLGYFLLQYFLESEKLTLLQIKGPIPQIQISFWSRYFFLNLDQHIIHGPKKILLFLHFQKKTEKLMRNFLEEY